CCGRAARQRNRSKRPLFAATCPWPSSTCRTPTSLRSTGARSRSCGPMAKSPGVATPSRKMPCLSSTASAARCPSRPLHRPRMPLMLERYALAVAALIACAAPAQAVDKVKASIPVTTGTYAMYYVADDKGYFKEEGLDVELTIAGGGVATPALMAGD